MDLLRLLPVILSILLLAAHFYRADNIILVILTAASPLLLIIKTPLVVRIIQLELILGGIEWIRTTIRLVKIRQDHNLPWERLAIILGSVAVFTILSALIFSMKKLRARYFTDQAEQSA